MELAFLRLEMPSDFPAEVLDRVHTKVTSRTGDNATRNQYLAAVNGLAYRFKACAEADDSFRASLSSAGDAPPQPERYHQEAQLFTFFVTGLASLECFGFALFAIGSLVDPEAFPMAVNADYRAVDLPTTTKRFESRFPSKSITLSMRAILDSPELQNWRIIRNTLAHRSSPGRLIRASTGNRRNTEPTEWRDLNFAIDSSLTAERRSWLAESLNRALADTEMLIDSQM